MSQRKANESSDRNVDKAGHKLDDVLSIGARVKITSKKSALQGMKQKQAVKELEKTGLVDKKDESDAKADSRTNTEVDPGVQFLMQMQLSDDTAASILIDNVEFLEVFLPAPVNETTAQISTWIGIIRCLEAMQVLDSGLASQFYDAANDHMFYAALMDEIEDDEAESGMNSGMSGMNGMDTGSSIGAVFTKPKAGERYTSEFSEIKALATELTKNLREITQKIPEYYNNVKNAVAQTKQTYNDYGLATASAEAARGVGSAGWKAIKKIWKALRNMNLSDLIPLVIDIALPLMAKATQAGGTMLQNPEERATFENMNRQYEASKSFFTGPTGSRIFGVAGAVNRAVNRGFGRGAGFMTDRLGNAVSTYEDLSEENMIRIGEKVHAGANSMASRISDLSGGKVKLQAAEGFGINDPRYENIRSMWRTFIMMAAPGASVTVELTMILFQVITAAVTSLAALSNKRIAKWAKLNGNDLRIKMNSVLKPHIDYANQYVKKLMQPAMDAPSKRMGRLVKVTLRNNITRQIGAENKTWREAAKVIQTMTKKGNSNNLSWFKSKVFQGLGAVKLVDALGLAKNTPLAALGKYNKYLISLRGGAEVVTYAIWRVRIKYYVDTIGDSVFKFKGFYETLNQTIDVNDFQRKMAQQQLQWTLQADWPLNPRALRAAAAQANDDDDDDAGDDDDDDYDEADWEDDDDDDGWEGANYVD